jgi:sigma-B regulation protein RsbU (phosphoserine phosphatase)
MLLLLWPIAWAAFELSPETGRGVAIGSALLYLLLGLVQMFRTGQQGHTLLALLLYLATFVGTFFLLRVVQYTEKEQAGATEGRPMEAPAMESQGAPAIQPVPTKEVSSTEEQEIAEPIIHTQEPAPVLQAAASSEPAAVESQVSPTISPVLMAAPPSRDDPVEDPLHQDLRVARDIQVSLLLASTLRLPGWEASTSFLPARELGGDLYDFIELDPYHRGIMIGDVTGKGIPAALHMAVTRTLFRMQAHQHPTPSEALIQINRSMIEQIPQGCVTMLYSHLNITDGSMCLANAGHNYPLLLGNSIRELMLNGLPLGIDGDYDYQEISAQLNPGEVLIFYTDGVVEATNPQGELFSFERLKDLLLNGTSKRPRTLTRQIVRAVKAFTEGAPQSDDITLVVLRRRYQDLHREIIEVSQDVLGVDKIELVKEQLEDMNLSADQPKEVWRAAILTLGNYVQDQWGRGASRELIQQLFLTLEGFFS